MIEIWKSVSEFPEHYEISNLGKVKRIANYSNQSNITWSANGNILKPKKHTNGYLTVILSVNGKYHTRYIHRLVAKEFCINKSPERFNEINHKDGNKENNCCENLEWCDRSYNNKHAYSHRLHTVHGCYGNKKSVAKIDKYTRRILEIFTFIESAAKAVDSLPANISACCNYQKDNTKYKHAVNTIKGFIWVFATNNMKIGEIYD